MTSQVVTSDHAPARAGAVLATLILVAAAANLPLAVANVALPEIGVAFDASQTSLNLIAVGYSLGLAASVLYLGAVGDRYGRKRMLLAGSALSIPTILGSAYAGNEQVLFVARVLGGVTAGMAYPTTLALITALWSGASRTRAIALWSAVGGALMAVGPLVAGALLQWFWWGSVFLMSLPVAVLALILVVKFVPAGVAESTDPVDHAGGALSIVGVGALVLAISFVTVPGARTAALVLLAITVVSVAGFVLRQRVAANPLYDLAVAGRRIFWVAAVAGIIVFGALMGALFIGQQFLQNVLGYDTLVAGSAGLPAAVCMVLAAPQSARLIERYGSRVTLLLGYAFFFVAFLLMFAWNESTSFWLVVVTFALAGTGVGLAGTPASHSLTGSVPVDRAGMASGTADLQRDLGGAVMQAIQGALLTAGYAAAMAASIAGAGRQLGEQTVTSLEKSFTGAAALAEQYPQYAAQIVAAAKDAFITGANWAYAAGLIAVVGGALLVSLAFPRQARERELLVAYHAEDTRR